MPAPPTNVHVRAVRRTTRPEAWRPVAEALGGQPIVDRADEQVYALDGGMLVVRRGPGDPVTAIELGAVDAGADRRVTGPDGLSLAIVTVPELRRELEPGIAEDRAGGSAAAVTVCPLWMTPDVPGVTATVQQTGPAVRLASTNGDWVDLAAPGGGLLAVHAGPVAEAVLCFEAPDVRALVAPFVERGLRADVVDENYGRSLRIDDPDGGVELWVNETITDLYGYRRAADAHPTGARSGRHVR